MNFISKSLALGMLAAATTLAAHATPINGTISGNDVNAVFNNANGTLNFGASGTVASNPSGFGPGATSPFYSGETMTFYQDTQVGSGGNFFYSTTPGGTLTLPGSGPTTGGVEVFSVTTGNVTLAFYVTSDTTNYINGTTPNSAATSIVLSGTGYFTETGYDITPAVFSLNGGSQPGVNGMAPSFSFGGQATATPSATPEPSSLMLLGTGFVSAAGMIFRKRRSIA